jgi:type VI secretion system protein ImpF
MPEAGGSDALQPPLLDRLIDDEPGRTSERRQRRVLTADELRESVRRDLAWLLETVHLAGQADLTPYPRAAASVINYGIPDLTGRTLSSIDEEGLARSVAEAIRRFEPRIVPGSLRVEVHASEEPGERSLSLRIRGALRTEPVPLPLLLRSDIDPESGEVRLAEDAG